MLCSNKCVRNPNSNVYRTRTLDPRPTGALSTFTLLVRTLAAFSLVPRTSFKTFCYNYQLMRFFNVDYTGVIDSLIKPSLFSNFLLLFSVLSVVD